MENKLGLFTEEDMMKVRSVKVQKEEANNVSGSKAAAAGLAIPCWAGGGAVAAGGFAAASAV